MVLYGASKKYRAKVTKTDTGKVVTPSSTVKSKELINKYSGIVSKQKGNFSQSNFSNLIRKNSSGSKNASIPSPYALENSLNA